MKFLDYQIKDEFLLQCALTHSSKSEHNYERLEFFGDSILDFLVSEYLYTNCPDKEGKLTVIRSHFVSENYLAGIFDKLKLAKYVKVGKSYQGELSKAIKGDIVESIIAVLYIECGLDGARDFILKHFALASYRTIHDDNYKSRLQELVQGNFRCKMSYDTVPCDKGFKSTFYMDEDKISTGRGSSKQEAEQDCAKKAIKKIFVTEDL